MFKFRSSMLFALLAGAATLAGAGCSADPPGADAEKLASTAVTFEEFESTVQREVGTGAYIVERDIPIHTRDALKAYFEKYVRSGALIVNTVGGHDDRWNDTQKHSLTYCVSTGFGANYNAVVTAMATAAAAWSNVSQVTYTHVSGQDGACNSGNNNVLFDVSPTSGQSYLARAFFPYYSRGGRNILIDSSSFGSIAPYTLTGILRHELGHTLGFRHEHTRPESGTCFEDNDWRALTGYDSASVMHYPQCRGTNRGDLVLTPRDIEGAATLYGPARARTSASQDGRVASLSRTPDSMDVFWITANGAVNRSYWSSAAGWRTAQLAPPGSAALHGNIAAVSRGPTSMELWYIGADGSIQDKNWYEGGNWGGFQLAPPGSASTDGGIAAVSRVPKSMELWYIGADGSIQDKNWYEGGNWGGFAIAPPGSASTHGSIAAVSRVPTSMELWYIGADGSIQDKNWYEGGNWGGFPLTGANAASLTGSIASVSRVPTSMELWYIGADGSIQDKNWYEGGNWGGFPLTGANAASLKGNIAAVSRIATALEFWYVGADGSIQDKYWYEGGEWSGFPLAAPGDASLDGSISVVSRIPNSLEFWYNGANGSVQDKLWYEGGNWGGFELAPAGSTAQ